MLVVGQLWKFFYWPLVWAVVIGGGLALGGPRVGGVVGLVLFAFGLLLLVLAFVLHGVAGRTLRLYGHSGPGRGFWPDRLVRVGIYSCMRHPQHLGLALVPVGLALMTGSLAAVAASGWGVAAALLFVVAVEERECLEKFGDDYCRYMREVPAFNPSPRCLAEGFRLLSRRA